MNNTEHIQPPPSRRRIAWIAGAVVLLLGVVAVLYFWQPWASQATAHDHDADGILYTCPMHPQVIEPEPGLCPICHMDLVPIKKAMPASDSQGDSTSMAGMVHVTPRDRVVADVATVEVGYRNLSAQLVVSAGVDYNEASHNVVSARFGGRIERLYVNQTGQSVRKGQPLMDIYSPELVTAEKEYLLARESEPLLSTSGTENVDPNGDQRRRDHAQRLVAASRKRLELLGMSAAQITALEQRGEIAYSATVFSPIGGTVINRAVTEGQYVNEGTMLVEIIDLSSVWVLANVFESDVHRVRIGSEMMVSGAVLGNETLHGKVTFIYPTVDVESRTVKVRGVFSNSRMQLRPGMYITATIRTNARDVLAVPATAVIRTGKHDLVYVEVKKNMFEPHEVTVGVKDGDYFEIIGGQLGAGDRVVTEGGYLLDSERQLTGDNE